MEKTETSSETQDGKGAISVLRVMAAVLLSLFIAFISVYYYQYLYSYQVDVPPKDLGFPELVMFCIAAFIVVIFPWRRSGLSIRRIGPVEFEKIIETQASERAEDLAEVEERLMNLEIQMRQVHDGVKLNEMFADPRVQELVLQFFDKHGGKAVSPLRLRKWGGRQQGFEKLGTIDPAHLRVVLRRLVSEGHLRTSISAQGNTLYRRAD